MIGIYEQLKKDLQGKTIFIFGAGKSGIEILLKLRQRGLKIAGIIDNNPNLKGTTIENVKVSNLEGLNCTKDNIVIFVCSMNINICEDITNQLVEYGFEEGKNFIVWKKLLELKIPLDENYKNLIEYYRTIYTGTFIAEVINKPSILNHPLGEAHFFEMYDNLERMYKKYVFPELELSEDKTLTELAINLIGTQDGEGIYIKNYLQKSMRVDGDICEFGIAQGATSAFMAHQIRSANKNIWLFDSFEGLSVPTKEDKLKDDIFNLGSMEKYAYLMKSSVNEVKQRLKQIDFDENKVMIVPGFIQDTIKSDLLPQKVCFAYVDFDLYEPIKIALDYLNEVISVGGTIIVDDYDFFSTGAKTAVDEFIEKHKNEKCYNFVKPIKEAGYFCVIERIK